MLQDGRRFLLGADALAVAKAANPAAPGPDTGANDPSGCAIGASVTGELVACSSQEVVIRRTDPLAGDIQVHFPRAGFELVPAS